MRLRLEVDPRGRVVEAAIEGEAEGGGMRGKAKASLDLIESCRDLLKQIQPASVRAVCYQLFARKLINSMSKLDTQRVSKQLVWAREQHEIPWGWITDETRAPEWGGGYDDLGDYMKASLIYAHKDRWADQPELVEVWSEKATIGGTIRPVLEDLGVTFRVMHGFASATAVYNAAQDGIQRSRTVLYVGDFDPSGLHMSEVDLPQRLARYGAGDLTDEQRFVAELGSITIKRIALTADDTKELKVPSFNVATKESDARHAWFVKNYGRRCWELDAMPPPVLRERVESEIMKFIEPEAWERAEIAERAQKESMRHFLNRWPGKRAG